MRNYGTFTSVYVLVEAFSTCLLALDTMNVFFLFHEPFESKLQSFLNKIYLVLEDPGKLRKNLHASSNVMEITYRFFYPSMYFIQLKLIQITSVSIDILQTTKYFIRVTVH